MAEPWSRGGALRGMFSRKTIDDDTWENLEDALIAADFGPAITDDVIEELRASVAKFRTTDPADLKRMLRESLEERLDPTLHLSARPAVVLVVGVNGVGRTTAIAKFAKFLALLLHPWVFSGCLSLDPPMISTSEPGMAGASRSSCSTVVCTAPYAAAS